MVPLNLFGATWAFACSVDEWLVSPWLGGGSQGDSWPLPILAPQPLFWGQPTFFRGHIYNWEHQCNLCGNLGIKVRTWRITNEATVWDHETETVADGLCNGCCELLLSKWVMKRGTRSRVWDAGAEFQTGKSQVMQGSRKQELGGK